MLKDLAGRRPSSLVAIPVALALSVPLLVACGSSGSGSSNGASRGASQAKAPAALCQQIGGVLADGPDPDSDPVGYALSQVRPLAAIQTSDASVAKTLSSLIAADKSLVATNGSDHSASKTIAQAEMALNAVCPGVSS